MKKQVTKVRVGDTEARGCGKGRGLALGDVGTRVEVGSSW